MAGMAFDDRDGWIWMDGSFVQWRDARVHMLTHALHYGSGVFEGLRAYGGKIFRLEEHTKRLFFSARLLDIDIPFSAEEINAACKEVLEKNGLEDAYLRPIVWRGAEMGLKGATAGVHLAIAAWEWGAYFPDDMKLDIARWRRPSPDTAPIMAKATGIYMIHTLASREASAKGFDDALMLDWRGQVAELTGANIFLIRDGVIHTPITDNCLDGITRRAVMELAARRGLEVVERAIWPTELPSFSECFVTGSAAEVASVASIGPYAFDVKNNEITRQMKADYAALVRA